MNLSIQTSSHIRNTLIVLACLVIILAGVKSAASIIIPLLLSLFVAVVCMPLVNFLVKYKIPMWLAIAILLLLIFIGFTFFAGLIGSAVNEFSASIPTYKLLLANRIAEIINFAERFDIKLHISRETIVEYFDPNIIMNLIKNLLSGVSGAITNIFVLLLIVVFMLFEAPLAKQKLNTIAIEKNSEKDLENIRKVLHSVNGYLAIKTLMSLLTAFAVWLVLTLLDVQYAVLWATVTFLLNYIPNIGSVLAAIPVIVQALILNGYSEAIVVTIAFIVINMLVGNILEPRLMGQRLGLSTLVVFISLIIWGWLLGTVGMLLSVPLTVALKIVLESNPKTKHYGYLLGDGR